MPFVVGPSRNPILQAAWAGHVAAQKAEGKAAKRAADVSKKPAKPNTSVKSAQKTAKSKQVVAKKGARK